MNTLLQALAVSSSASIAVSVVIQIALVSGVALLVSRVFARQRPDVRSAVLLSALVCCLLSPLLTIAYQSAGIRTVQYRVAPSVPTDSVLTDLSADVPLSAAVAGVDQPLTQNAGDRPLASMPANEVPTAVSNTHTVSTMVAAIIVSIYVLVALLLAIGLFRGWQCLRTIRSESTELSSPRFTTAAESACKRLGLGRVPKLVSSPRVSGPMTIGTLQPLVVIPEALIDSIDDRQLQHILLHECAHVLRRDCLVGFLQRLLGIIYWPHPLIHILNAELAAAREETCDNYVLCNCQPQHYGQTLLGIATALPNHRTIAPAVGLFSRREKLEHRIKRILDPRRTVVTQLRSSLLVGIAICFLSLVTVAAGSRVTLAQEAANTASFDDAALNGLQRTYRDWTNERFGGLLNEANRKQLSDAQRSAQESEWIKQLNQLQGRERIPAINALAVIGSKKAVKPLSQIAFDRAERDNRDRWMAVRALGMLGDESVVPDLVHLTYHYNLNTRLWAQISLVRLTGKNYGNNVQAWQKWWTQSDKQPPISSEKIVWTTRKEWSDPKAMMQVEQEFLEKISSAKPQRAPKIVSTSPKVGATDVDPKIKGILVTFDRDMASGFSWTGGGEEFPPSPDGEKAKWLDQRTCILPVQLQSGKFYRVGINSDSFKNFKSTDGVPVAPSAIYFVTKGAADAVKNKAIQPDIVRLQPANGTKDVDPALTELRVTFNVPMGEGFSWTGGGKDFPEVPDGTRPRWSKDRMTCVLPVKLKPNWTYRLGLNSRSFKNFQSAGGVPLEPVVYSFQTGASR